MAITFDDILAARKRIGSALTTTPCAPCSWLDLRTHATVRIKLESLQPSGSFKDRGALNKLLLLTDEERARGVIAASAGNHAQAVALHAKRLGIHAVIVMPETSPLIKIENTRAHGAEVVLAGATYDASAEHARKLAAERNLVAIHAFDDDAVVAGQGTIGLELLEQFPDVEVVVVPVGGGGMIGGIAVALKAQRPSIRIVGVQSALVPGMHSALVAKHPVSVAFTPTLADGIAVRKVAERTLAIVEEHVESVALVTEDEIAAAVLFLIERQKTVAEGAGAAAVAALLAGKIPHVENAKVCAIIGGGNIDVTMLGKVIDRGLVDAGRLVRLHVRLHDRPGALADITAVFARLKANVVEIEHERAFTHSLFSDVEVFSTLETRGPEHVAEIIAALEGIAEEVRAI